MINQDFVTQDTINQRLGLLIEFFIQSKRVRSQTQFAEAIGTNQSQINSVMNGKGRNAGAEMIGRTLQVYPDVNPYWLQGLSDGPMLLDGNAISRGLFVDQEFVELPFVRAHMRATFTENLYGDLPPEIEKIRVMYVSPTKSNRQGVVFEVNGDSMEPGYPPGAQVLALPVDPGDWQYMSAGVYAVSFRRSFVIKRVRDNELMAKGLLTLHSDSPDGGSQPVRIDDIRAIWKIDRIVYSPAR